MLSASGRRFVAAVVFMSLPAIGAERAYDFQRKVLSNGMTVLSLEDHSCPIVAVQVWYHVGSKNENPQRQGFAHLFEHMMFRGTDRLGPQDHFKFIRGTGGYVNGFTSFDNTTYVNTAPSNQLELVLWLEAERLAFLRVDEEGFYTERGVVEEERRMRSLNTPYGTVPEKVLPVIFTKHPYQWTPIGQIPHLRAATLEEVQAFWDRYYTPSNAVLVVVGDVTHDGVAALAEKYFAWIPSLPKPPRVSVVEPAQTEPRRITIPEKKGPVPLVALNFRAVPKNHDDALPLEMLMTILGQGESSRLHRDLVKERKLAQAITTMEFLLEDDGVASVGAAILPMGDKQKTLAAIRENIQRIRTEGITPRELEKTRNQYIRNTVTNSLTCASKADLLGRCQTLEGGAEKANERLARIRAVTLDDMLRVAKTYFAESRETQMIVEPESGALLGAILGAGKKKGTDTDEGAAPATKPAVNRVAVRGAPRTNLQRPTGFPEKPPVAGLLESVPKVDRREETLANGLKVVVVPNHEVPFVSMMLGVLNGAWTEDKPGTASMACSMITKGTTRHTAAELAEEIEFNAISLGAGAGADVASVNASCVAEKFETAVTLMAEVVRTPTFSKDEFSILRQQVVMGLMIQSKTPEYVAEREMSRRLFGNHPYARTTSGELEDVQRLSADDAKAWWGRFVRPDSATLYIAGDVDPDAAVKFVRAQFGDWRVDAPKPEVTLAEIPAPQPTHIWLVNRPGSVQSQIRVGRLGVGYQHPRHFNGRVFSLIFGGGFNSRLNKAIRVEKGLTYGAGGGMSPSRFAGTFRAGTFTKTSATAEAIRLILREIEKLQAAPPDADELDTARSYIVGGFAGQRETPEATIGDLWLIEYAKLPQDYLMRMLDGVKRTGAEDVSATARELIDRNSLTIVVVGEADQLKADLEKIAPVTVVQGPSTETKPASAKEAAK